VGDKTTLVLAPMLSAYGLTVAKMWEEHGSQGGTIDKLESISGFRTALAEDEFIRQVNCIELQSPPKQKTLLLPIKVVCAPGCDAMLTICR
jgi:thymidine phosphorylase